MMSSLLAKRRLWVALVAAFLVSLVALARPASYPNTLTRFVLVALLALIAFGVLERWPQRLPNWVARWVIQVAGVAISIPLAMAFAYFLTTFGSPIPWYQDELRLLGYQIQTLLGLLIAPWIAVAALFRQIKDEARHQALTFALERSQLEQQAVEARLRLLQAQVEPHFLFNTLANVRELVVAGSPQASMVLDSLINYLRGAVPRLQADRTTLSEEFELVRAYLDVMRMRIPDRLQFAVELPSELAAIACPPMSVLTLVENAVRHGIDPSIHGGRIDVMAQQQGDMVIVEVRDTGVGLRSNNAATGTGLATLRQRLALAFGETAALTVFAATPHGAVARLQLPLREKSA